MASIATGNGAFIDGEWIAGGGPPIEVRNPADGELVGTVTAATPEIVDAAVESAHRCFGGGGAGLCAGAVPGG